MVGEAPLPRADSCARKKDKETQTPDCTDCPVCFDAYEENGDHVPRILQCFHAVCEKCVKRLIHDGSLECPECRAKHIADSGVLSFPQNKYIVSSLRQIQR